MGLSMGIQGTKNPQPLQHLQSIYRIISYPNNYRWKGSSLTGFELEWAQRHELE